MSRFCRILVVAVALTALMGFVSTGLASASEPAKEQTTVESTAPAADQAVQPAAEQNAAPAEEPSMHHQMEEVAKQLGGQWALPFALLLLSIAICPLAVPHFWHHHFGKVAAFWALAYVVPFMLTHGFGLAMYSVLHTVLLEYIPFIILLLALFTITGGVRVTGTLVGKPAVNLGFLVLGTVLASWMGTTGASMLLIRPLLRANNHRRYKIHTIVFFIFLVANIGGSLTPLGDPPLFLGFLKGVSFFWVTLRMLPITLFVSILLFVLYFAIETMLYAKEGKPAAPAEAVTGEKLGIEGGLNMVLLAGVLLGVFVSGVWHPGVKWTIFQLDLELQDVSRDLFLLVLTYLSMKFTTSETRRKNEFEWAPILEVGKIFLGIFISMIPALAILRAGTDGALRDIIAMVSHNGEPVNAAYFWLSGGLSSFLDNAPTYLVFFNTAGGDATHLMGEWSRTLLAISAGSVFMGANSYIGNAPNFMVRSISESSGVKMPSFFGYMAWSVGILVPIFIVTTFIFF